MSHKGLYKTTDGGVDEEKSWQNLTPALTKFLAIQQATVEQITSLSIDNQNPLVIYITYDNFIFVSRDGGLTWGTLNTITPTLSSASNNVPEIKKIGLMNGTIYYGAGNALYRSDDKGVSWASFDIPILGDVKYTVSDPKDLNIIYVGALYVK